MSIGATLYSLVYGIEAVLPIEVEIPSLRVLREVELEEAEWVQAWYEQGRKIRILIDENSKPCAEEERNIKVLNYFESRAKENSNYKVHQKILNIARNRGRISGIIVVKNLEWDR